MSNNGTTCEGCHGSGGNRNCDGNNDSAFCRCQWHTECSACSECGGCGVYDCDCADNSCHDQRCDCRQDEDGAA